MLDMSDACFREQHWAEPDLYLMADEALVESAENAVFRICPMEKAPEPVLVPDMPWEGGDGSVQRPVQQDPLDGSVLYDPQLKRFHLWYRTHNRLASKSIVCYACSEDGLHWVKPSVGAIDYEGSYDNNMLKMRVPPVLNDHLCTVVPNYVAGLDAKLIATVYSKYNDPIYPGGITFLSSRNGIDWEPHFPPMLPIDGDAHCLMWDPRNECYICTTRSAAYSGTINRLRQAGYDNLKSKRHVAIARSRDLVHWTPMVTVLEADDKDPENAQLYIMYVIPYGHAYIGLVQLFYMSRDMTYGPLDVHLVISRNLTDWVRVGDRTPILPRGEKGSWDHADVTICAGTPHPEGDRMRFWYGGKDTEHWQAGNGALGTATLRRDGFACWEAGDTEGCITTVPLDMHWATWPFLNVEAPDGEVRMEIIDAETYEPVRGVSRDDCLPITGNHLRAMVEFKEGRGNFIRHAGKVRFRFYLRRARLYAFKAPNILLEGDYVPAYAWL
ncbi:MAG: hypothetical protein PHT33_15535 [bacterium]|nr:hypothetical protein [bacterium]